MLHKQVMATALGNLLRTAREAKGLTQTQVGTRVGLTYSAVGQYETGSIKKPRPEKVAAIAEVLGIDHDTLAKHMLESYGLASPSDNVVTLLERKPKSSPPREIELAPDAPNFDELGDRRDVPEYGIAVGGEEGDFSLNGEVVGYVTRPRSLRGRNVFAVRVKGSSMEPRFDEGDVLYIEKHQEPRIGDDGVFEMKPTDEWEAGHAFVKRLVAKSMGSVRVRQFNPEKEFSYGRNEIKQMYRVVPRNELVSV